MYNILTQNIHVSIGVLVAMFVGGVALYDHRIVLGEISVCEPFLFDLPPRIIRKVWKKHKVWRLYRRSGFP